MSGVHYKFKSNLYYDTVTFDGVCITVTELKKLIMEAKKLGKSNDYDLEIIDTQTKQVYKENEEIKKNASVLVRRVPVAESTVKSYKPKTSSPMTLEKLTETPDLLNANASESDKIKAMFYQSTQQYNPSNYTVKPRPSGPPPDSYVCHRCQRPGHFIQNCPNAPLMPRIPPGERPKRPTGMPLTHLKPVSEHTPGAMISSAGTWVINDVSREGYLNPKKEKPPSALTTTARPTRRLSAEQRSSIPTDLICPLCKDLITEASVIPCCSMSGCDECVRTALMESEEHQCPLCGAKGTPPDSIVSNKFLRKTVKNFISDTGYRKHGPAGGPDVQAGSTGTPPQPSSYLPPLGGHGGSAQASPVYGQGSPATAAPAHLDTHQPGTMRSPGQHDAASGAGPVPTNAPQKPSEPAPAAQPVTNQSAEAAPPRRSTTPTQDESATATSAGPNFGTQPTPPPQAGVPAAAAPPAVAQPYPAVMPYQHYHVPVAHGYQPGQMYMQPTAYGYMAPQPQPVVNGRQGNPPLSQVQFDELQRRARDEERRNNDEVEAFIKSLSQKDKDKRRRQVELNYTRSVSKERSGPSVSKSRSPSPGPRSRTRSRSRSRGRRRSWSRSRSRSKSPRKLRPARSRRSASRSPVRPKRRERERERKGRPQQQQAQQRYSRHERASPRPSLPEFTDPPPAPEAYMEYYRWAQRHDKQWVEWFEEYRRWYQQKQHRSRADRAGRTDRADSRSLSPMTDDEAPKSVSREKPLPDREKRMDDKPKKTKRQKRRSSKERKDNKEKKGPNQLQSVDLNSKDKERGKDRDKKEETGWELESDEEQPKAVQQVPEDTAKRPVQPNGHVRESPETAGRPAGEVDPAVRGVVSELLTEVERREAHAQTFIVLHADDTSQSEDNSDVDVRSHVTAATRAEEPPFKNYRPAEPVKEKPVDAQRDSRNVIISSTTGEALVIEAPKASKWEDDDTDSDVKSIRPSVDSSSRTRRRVFVNSAETLDSRPEKAKPKEKFQEATNVQITVKGGQRRTSLKDTDPRDQGREKPAREDRKRLASEVSRPRPKSPSRACAVESVVLSIDTRKRSTEIRGDRDERSHDHLRVSEERRFKEQLRHDHSGGQARRQDSGPRGEDPRRHYDDRPGHAERAEQDRYDREERYHRDAGKHGGSESDSHRPSKQYEDKVKSGADENVRGKHRSSSSSSSSEDDSLSPFSDDTDAERTRHQKPKSRSQKTVKSSAPDKATKPKDDARSPSDHVRCSKSGDRQEQYRRSRERREYDRGKDRRREDHEERALEKEREKQEEKRKQKEREEKREREREDERKQKEKELVRERIKLEEIERMKEEIKEEIRMKEREKMERELRDKIEKERQKMRKEAEKKARQEVRKEERERLQRKLEEIEKLQQEAGVDLEAKKRQRSESDASPARATSSDKQAAKRSRQTSLDTSDSENKSKKSKKEKKEKKDKKKKKKKKKHTSKYSSDSE